MLVTGVLISLVKQNFHIFSLMSLWYYEFAVQFCAHVGSWTCMIYPHACPDLHLVPCPDLHLVPCPDLHLVSCPDLRCTSVTRRMRVIKDPEMWRPGTGSEVVWTQVCLLSLSEGSCFVYKFLFTFEPFNPLLIFHLVWGGTADT